MRAFEEIVTARLNALAPYWGEFAHKAVTRPGYLRWLIRQLPGKAQPGSTYFLRLDAPIHPQPVKIGFSFHPEERVEMFATGSPYTLTMLAAYPDRLLPEKLLHQRYAHLRLRGEWFSPDEELAGLIADVTVVSTRPPLIIGQTEGLAVEESRVA